MSDVKFKVGTQDEYDKSNKSTDSFYLTEPGGGTNSNVYLGNVKLNNGVDLEAIEKSIEELEQRVNDLEAGIAKKPLNECTYAQIQANIQAGVAEDIWSVGDTTNLITFNGALGDYLTFEDYKCKAILIGFDHNKDLETGGKYNITLQFGQDEDGINIAFIDSRYNSTGNSYNCLCMNLTNTNVGGWESSHMRNDICPQFLELLPSNLQNIIGTTTKYTDNVGDGSGSVESNITATQDKIFLLNYYEVSGTGAIANSYEADYTEPYSEMYSSNQSSRIKYSHSASGSTSIWGGRSPYQSGSRDFCSVSTSGNTGSNYAYNSIGFAPAFTIY